MRKRILRPLAVAVVLSVVPGFALAKQASQSAVLGACARTEGCVAQGCGGGAPKAGGCVQGCSPTVCFKCNGKTCVSTRGLGGKPVPGGGLGGILKNAPPGSTSSSNAGNRPVNNTEPVTERVGGKH
jgi:hypothetical protein